MEEGSLFNGKLYNLVRVGIVVSVDFGRQIAKVKIYDSVENNIYTCPLYHPVASGNGKGIFSCLEVGCAVLLGMTFQENYFIIGTIQSFDYSSDSQITKDFLVEDNFLETLKPGELLIKSSEASKIKISKDKIKLSSSFNDLLLSDDLLINSFDNAAHFGSSKIEYSGLIKREKRKAYSRDEDKQSESYLRNLQEVGINTNNPTLPYTSLPNAKRNPALVENKTLYLNTDYSGGLFPQTIESQDLSDENIISLTNGVNAQKTFALPYSFGLNPNSTNALAEFIVGSGVDFSGNLLNINRDRIKQPEDISQETISDYLRKANQSIKTHFELNSYKTNITEISKDKLDAPSSATPEVKTGQYHSRFFADIDGNGLFKMNIPASQNGDALPLHYRYIPSAFDNDKYAPIEGEEIAKLQYDASFHTGGGIKHKDKLFNLVHHDILTLCDKLSSSVISTEDYADTNTGGNSFHLNADGAVLLSIGKDSKDNKSITLDTAGSIVGALGKDKLGNSLSIQMDGGVKIQIGGSITANNDSDSLISPDIEIKIIRRDVTHSLTIGKDISIKSGNNLVLKADKNIILDAGSDMMLRDNTNSIKLFGSYSEDGEITDIGTTLINNNGTRK